MPVDDADRAMQHFRALSGDAATVLAHAFHTRLVDSCSTKLETEVFQVKLAPTSVVTFFETSSSAIDAKSKDIQGLFLNPFLALGFWGSTPAWTGSRVTWLVSENSQTPSLAVQILVEIVAAAVVVVMVKIWTSFFCSLFHRLSRVWRFSSVSHQAHFNHYSWS